MYAEVWPAWIADLSADDGHIELFGMSEHAIAIHFGRNASEPPEFVYQHSTPIDAVYECVWPRISSFPHPN